MHLKNNANVCQPAVVTSKHDDRSYVVQMVAGNQYRSNRRYLYKIRESHKSSLTDDFQPFDTRSHDPKGQSSPTITKSPSTSPILVKSSSQNSSQNSSQGAVQSNTPTKSTQPYITRSGRAVKHEVLVSV